MVSALDLAVRIRGCEILSGVCLRLDPGELLAVIGPNGAGKSTLLRCLAGESSPTSGCVELNRRPMSGWSPLHLARQRAVLPQETIVAFPLTVLQVVLAGRYPHLRDTYARRNLEIAWAALECVGARFLEERDYRTLSGGERQRVQMARVLAQIWDPVREGNRFLFLDEHTSNLDPRHEHAMFRLAREVAGRGIGVLAIVHDLNLAATYADRIAVMDAGRLVEIGAPADVLTESLLLRVFDLRSHVMRHPLTGSPLVLSAEGCGRKTVGGFAREDAA